MNVLKTLVQTIQKGFNQATHLELFVLIVEQVLLAIALLTLNSRDRGCPSSSGCDGKNEQDMTRLWTLAMGNRLL